MLTVHPRHILQPGDDEVIEVALAMAPGMGGWGPLPFAGGYAEQPAALMDVCRSIVALKQKLDRSREQGRR